MIEPSRIWRKPDCSRSLPHSIQSWIDGVLSTVFPSFCLHCWRPFSGDAGQPLCERCLATVNRPPGGRCRACGQFLGPATSTQSSCRNCRDRNFSFQRVYALGRYTPPLRTWVHKMKFENRPVLGYTLGQKLAEQIGQAGWDQTPSLITAIPLTPFREANRWFNQAQLIAAGLHDVTDLPVYPDLLVKTTSTTPQVELTRQERIRNITPDVFDVPDGQTVRDAHVLLVDDVMTTGSTLNAAGAVLLDNGAASVQVAVLGR